MAKIINSGSTLLGKQALVSTTVVTDIPSRAVSYNNAETNLSDGKYISMQDAHTLNVIGTASGVSSTLVGYAENIANLAANKTATALKYGGAGLGLIPVGANLIVNTDGFSDRSGLSKTQIGDILTVAGIAVLATATAPVAVIAGVALTAGAIAMPFVEAGLNGSKPITIGDLYNSAVNATSQGIEAIADFIKNTANTIGQTYNNISEKIKNMRESISNAINDAMQKSAELANQIADAVKNMADNIADKIRDTFDDVADKVKKVIDDTSEKINDAIERGKKALDDFVDDAVKTGKETAQNSIMS